MSFNAGAIEANLTLGRSAWLKDLKQTKKEITDLENTSIGIDIDLFDDNARVAMDNLELLLDDLGRSTYTPEVDVETRDANVRLSRLDDRLDALDSRSVTVMVYADADNADIILDNLENDLLVLDNNPVRVEVEVLTREALAELDVFIAKLDKLDLRTVTVTADADIDNAVASLSTLDLMIDATDKNSVNVKVDVDAADAQTDLIDLASFIQAIDMSSIDIDVDVDDVVSAIGEMAALDAAISVVDGRDIDIDVDVDGAALASLVGTSGGSGGGSLGLLKILLYAIILLSPILAVAIGALSAAIIGFVSAMVGAAGAAGVLAGGLIGLVARFNELDPSEYTGPMQAFADSIDAVKGAWDTFLDGIEGPGFNLMADALNLVADILPTLTPLFIAVADAMGGVLGGIREFVESSEYDEMIGFFSGFGVDMLVIFMGILGNLIQFFGRLFDAIAPFATQMMGSLEEVTQGWADWADDLENNKSFQKFVDNAIEYGPKLLDMLGSLIQAFMSIGEAIEPIAGPMLDGLIFLFDLIADAPVDVLTGLIGGFAGIWFGLNVLAPILTTVGGAFSLVAGALGLPLLPIVLIVGAIAGLIGTMIYLWHTSEDFRDRVTRVWEAIKAVVTPIVEDIRTAIEDNWDPMVAKAEEIFESIQSIVEDAMIIIEAVIMPILYAISVAWDKWGDDIIDYVVTAFTYIGDFIGGFFTLIEGLFQTFAGLFTGDWDKMWGGIIKMAEGFWAMLESLFKLATLPLRTAFEGIKNAITDVWNNGMTWIQTKWTNTRTWIEEKWDNFRTWFSGLTVNPLQIFASILEKWISTRENIEGKWTNFKEWFSGLGVNAAALWDDITAKWTDMKTNIETKWTNLKTWFSGLSIDASGLWDSLLGAFKGVLNSIIDLWNAFSLTVDIPDAIPGLPDSWTISTPDVPHLAAGAYLTSATLNVAGEAGNEIVAPEPILRKIVEEHSGSKIDYEAMGAAVASALRGILGSLKGVTPEDLERLIEAASVNIHVGDDRDDALDSNGLRNLMFELRRLGYGGPIGVGS